MTVAAIVLAAARRDGGRGAGGGSTSIGVGGAGMSAYARAAAALGASVSGSDRADSPFVDALRADGVLDAGDRARRGATCPTGDDVEVVYSSGDRRRTTPSASRRSSGDWRVRTRAELLGELTALRRTIAVAGAHGKTTTASMIVARAARSRPRSRAT